MTDIWDKNAQAHQETTIFLREMKEQTTRLSNELRVLKTDFTRHSLMHMQHLKSATFSQKKVLNENPNGKDILVEHFWETKDHRHDQMDDDRGDEVHQKHIGEEDQVDQVDDDVFLKQSS